MAAKRGPTSELNHDNWDEDDKSEEAGQFAQAASDVLKDRVIKKAKRRGIGNTGGESASIFAGFGGFKVAQKTEAEANPFEFLAKTAGQGEAEGPPASKKVFKFDLPVKPLEGKIAPVFQFGTGNAPREPTKPLSGFSIGEKKPATTGFTFGSSNPSFVFGAKDSSTNEASSFKFGSTASSEPPKASFSFGSIASKPASEDASKLGFSFGGSPPKAVTSEPAKPESESSVKTLDSTIKPFSEKTSDPNEKQPSLMEMFKPKPGSWKCSVCDVTNNADKDSCVACTTPKPGGGPVSAPANKTAPAKKWECPTCMVPNDPEKLKCVCCETSKPGAPSSASEPPKKLSDSSVTGSGFKFGVVESSSSTPASTTGFSFGTLPAASTTPNNGFKFGVAPTTNPEAKNTNTSVTYSAEFLADLKELNHSVTEWVKGHVEKNGYIYLTPIFQDYEKHLSELKEQYKVKDSDHETPAKITGLGTNGVVEKKKDIVPEIKTGFTFGTTATTEPRSGFSFGSASLNSEKAKGFSIGATISMDKKPGFSFGSGAGDTNSPFSFGANPTGFSFSSLTSKPAVEDKGASQETGEGDEEDAPPKVEVSTVVEEDSLFSIRCKIFYKKGSEFVEKGLGMLHLKPVEADGGKKTQMLIRAETNLGNILLNVMLNSKMNFLRRNNNLQFVCIPNPPIPGVDGPVTMLIKVKNADAATDLETKINNRLTDGN